MIVRLGSGIYLLFSEYEIKGHAVDPVVVTVQLAVRSGLRGSGLTLIAIVPDIGHEMHVLGRGKVQTHGKEVLLGYRIIVVTRVAGVFAIDSIVDLVGRTEDVIPGKETQLAGNDISMNIEGNAFGSDVHRIDGVARLRGLQRIESILFKRVQETFDTNRQRGGIVIDKAFQHLA